LDSPWIPIIKVNHHRLLASRVLACALLLIAASCTTIEVRKDEPVATWMGRASVKRKSVAAAHIGGGRIAGQPVEEFFRRHSAIVSDGGMPRIDRHGRESDKGAQLTMPVTAGYGTAVSLGDGYFLTAAHVPVEEKGGLVCMEHGTRPVVRPYRVVWKDSGNGRDVALLHAEVEVPAVKWADSAALQAGASIFTYGFGGGEWKASQGQIVGRKSLGESGSFHDLMLSAPVVCGDSGGPAFTVDGRLAGIVTRADHRWVELFGRAWIRSRSHATSPDTDLLRKIIAKDRAARGR
jgi:S1-C subfamily serine protease